jgi:hypothetical protein
MITIQQCINNDGRYCRFFLITKYAFLTNNIMVIKNNITNDITSMPGLHGPDL